MYHTDTFVLDKADYVAYFASHGVPLADNADIMVSVFDGAERLALIPLGDVRLVVTVSPREVEQAGVRYGYCSLAVDADEATPLKGAGCPPAMNDRHTPQ